MKADTPLPNPTLKRKGEAPRGRDRLSKARFRVGFGSGVSAKQRSWSSRLSAFLICCFAIILVLLPVHAFLSTWLGTAIGPLLVWKSWKEILLVILVIPVIVFCVLQPTIARTMWRRPVNKAIAAYVILHLALTTVSNTNTEAVLAGLMFNLRFLAIFVLAQIIAESGHPWVVRLQDRLPLWLLGTMVTLGIVAIAQVTVLPLDFLAHFGYNKDASIAPAITVDQNAGVLRAFATMRGPNTLGAYLLIPIALAAALYIWRRHMAYAICVLVGVITVVLTGSRSAWLGLLAVAVVMVLFLVPKQHIVPAVKRWALPSVVALLLLIWASIAIPTLRIAVYHSSPGDSSLFEGSTDLHGRAVADGLRLALQHPLGMGPGNSGPATFYRDAGVNLPENYFLQLAQEVGLLGLALFVTICVLVAIQLYTRHSQLWPQVLFASFIGLTVINLFLHGWADDPTAMTWWGLAGLFIGHKQVSDRH